MPSACFKIKLGIPIKLLKFVIEVLKYLFCFILVYIPYRNFVLMATNLCVFIFFPFLSFVCFVLFCFCFVLHAVPCVGTLFRE